MFCDFSLMLLASYCVLYFVPLVFGACDPLFVKERVTLCLLVACEIPARVAVFVILIVE